jgi:hypothetical protein
MDTLFEIGKPTLTVEQFGEQLIETEDLDPVYVLLYRSGLSPTRLSRWMLGYWWFYSAGTASWIYDQASFYDAAMRAASSKEFQRGAERRHFRGTAATDTVLWFQRAFPDPAKAVDYLSRFNTFGAMKQAVLEWPLFGPWISFKVCDMLERVLAWKIDFSDCKLLEFYSEPREGAAVVAAQRGETAEETLRELLRHFSSLAAPPALDRSCGIQEIETILCKYKSYLNGHYYVGKDWKEIERGLRGKGRTAEHLLAQRKQ